MSRLDHDFANGNGTNGMSDLKQVRTEGSIVLTPEMFERMYLSPQNKVDGGLRKVLANPTPIGLGGFLIAYCPLIFSILGFRDYGGNGAATVGTYFFSGGLLAILTCIMEFILGNTFPAVFFGVFGGYFLSFGATLLPSFNAYIAYADPTSTNPSLAAAEATQSAPFLSGLAFWQLMMAIFSLYCAICALRINIVFFLTFFLLTITFTLIAASYWVVVQPDMQQMGHNLMIAGGSFGFAVIPLGWYLLLALMLTTVDFPLNLPVGDLSQVIPSATELRKRKMRSTDVEKGE